MLIILRAGIYTTVQDLAARDSAVWASAPAERWINRR